MNNTNIKNNETGISSSSAQEGQHNDEQQQLQMDTTQEASEQPVNSLPAEPKTDIVAHDQPLEIQPEKTISINEATPKEESEPKDHSNFAVRPITTQGK